MPGRRHSVAARVRRLPQWGRSLLALLLVIPHAASSGGVDYLVGILREVGELLRAWFAADAAGRAAFVDAVEAGEDAEQGRRFRRLIGGDDGATLRGAGASRSRSPRGPSAV